MKKILILLVMAAALFSSCTGKKGGIFGSVDWDAAVAATGTTPPAKPVDGVTRVVSKDDLIITYTVTPVELPDSARGAFKKLKSSAE